MSAQTEALRLADALVELDAQFSQPGLCGEAAAELRRLHEQNADYANTIDGLIISSCADVARIVGLEDMRDELMAALQMWLDINATSAGFDGKYGKALDSAIAAQQLRIDAAASASRTAIAKAEVGIDASR